MKLPRIIILTVLVLLIGATSQSKQSYLVTFSSPESSNLVVASIIDIAIDKGFSEPTKDQLLSKPLKIYHGTAHAWIEVSVVSPASIEVAWNQLHGGCGAPDGVDYSEPIMEEFMRKNSENLGIVSIETTASTNKSSQKDALTRASA